MFKISELSFNDTLFLVGIVYLGCMLERLTYLIIDKIDEKIKKKKDNRK